jgi:hypothetical protein
MSEHVNPHEIENRIDQLRYFLDNEPELTDWEFDFIDGRIDALGEMEETLEEGETVESEMIFTEGQAEVFDRIWKQRVLDKEEC